MAAILLPWLQLIFDLHRPYVYMCLQQCITVKIFTGVFKKISLFVMPPPLGAGGIMFLGCLSVRQSEAWNTLLWPVHGSVGPPDQPWPFYGMSVRPSVRPERFPGICWRAHRGNGLKFYMLMCLDHLQNWLVYGHSLFIFSCDQAALQMVLSVCLSVCPPVTPFWLFSHHRIIMNFSEVITHDQSKVHAKGQGHWSKVKVTEVTTQLNCFWTVTPVWIHIWWWNDAYSLMLLRKGALLLFKIIRQISRSHGSKNCRIWPRLGISGL